VTAVLFRYKQHISVVTESNNGKQFEFRCLIILIILWY